MQPFWADLYEFGVDVMLQGHDHDYERMGPTGPTGAADPTYGVRPITVGTGGAALFGGFGTIVPTSEVRSVAAYGVLKLTLHPSSYDWEFFPIAGQTFTDSGTGTVHDAPPSTNNALWPWPTPTPRRRTQPRSSVRRACSATTPMPIAIR